MQIIEKTSNRIVAQESFGSYLFGYLFASVFVSVGLLSAFVFFQRKQMPGLNVDTFVALLFFSIGMLFAYFNSRTKILAEKFPARVQVENEKILGGKIKIIPAEGLQAVHLESIWHSGKHSHYSYAVSLSFGKDRIEKLFDTENEYVVSLFGIFGKTKREQLQEVGKALSMLFQVPYTESEPPSLWDRLTGKAKTQIAVNL
ncbi:MAG TPA: hypothetical protein VI874_00090 [Candidatus Norongarragalinales archaeon]|nr:hypothetical protein [Candidatus Norongarragalinales archaeon]